METQSSYDFGSGVSSKRIYHLLGINLIGFALIFLLDLAVQNLISDLNKRLDNEQSRVSIGELLSNDIARLEAKTFQMATTLGVKGQAWINREIETIFSQMDASLNILEHGGELVRETRVNIESQESMVRRYHYVPEKQQGYVLESIDLKPKLRVIHDKIDTLTQLLKLREEHRNTKGPLYTEVIAETMSLLQTFPPLFTRMSENANRMFYQSQRKLDAIHADIQQQKTFYAALQTLLSLSIIGIVLFLGLRLLRQVGDSNKQLHQLARNLKQEKFALDQHAIVSITDVRGNITYANDKFCEISGYSQEELLGKNHRIVKSDEHGPEVYREMWRTIASGKTWHGEVKNRTKDGGSYWVAATIVPFLGEDGKPFQYVSIRTDITTRKRMEEEALERNRFLTSLTNAMGEGVYALDANSRCHFLNPEAKQLLGWSQEELAQRGIHDTIHHQLDEEGNREGPDKCRILSAVKKGEVYRADSEEFIRRDGTVFPVSLVSVPLFNEETFAGSVTVFQDITQRRQDEHAMAEARQAAEDANRAKSDFLSSMSHELRTPLNAIIGFSQTLGMEALNDEQHDQVREIGHAGEHLLGLVNEILDLARIESGRLELSTKPVSLDKVVDECVSLTQTLADGKGITIATAIETSGLHVQADYTRFKQVLLNLMSNGIKYNRDNGTLTIRVEGEGSSGVAKVLVSDTGMGLTAEQLAKLFQPFERLGQDATSTEGTGIGLVITKDLVELMQGEIGVESEHGQGSTFWFTLPLTEAEAVEAKQAPRPSEAQQEAASDEAAGSTTILYIDDNRVNLKLVEKFLQKRPELELHTTQDPHTGLEMAAELKPAMILLDINMPVLNGYQVVERLQQDPATKLIPVIGLSANAMPSDIESALAAGFSDYLTKPINIMALFAAIEKWKG